MFENPDFVVPALRKALRFIVLNECLSRHLRFFVYRGLILHSKGFFWEFFCVVCSAEIIGNEGTTIYHVVSYRRNFAIECVYNMRWRRCFCYYHSFRQTHFATRKATYKNLERLSGGRFHNASNGKCIMAAEVDRDYSKKTV